MRSNVGRGGGAVVAVAWRTIAGTLHSMKKAV